MRLVDNLEEQREILAAAGLDVDVDSALGPLPAPPPIDPRDMRAPGRIRVKERPQSTDWDKKARCLTERHDPDMFFPTRTSTTEDVARAKNVCRGCPVRWECLAYSVNYYEKLGIWGGFAEIERREIRHDIKRRIADGLLNADSQEDVLRYLEHRWGTTVRPVRRGEGG